MYHTKLGFLVDVNTEDICVRTTAEVRTHQVAEGILFGMDPATSGKPWPVYTQPESVSKTKAMVAFQFPSHYTTRLTP